MKRRDVLLTALLLPFGWLGFRRKSKPKEPHQMTACDVFGAAHEAGVRFHIRWYENGYGLPGITVKKHYSATHQVGIRSIWGIGPSARFCTSIDGRTYEEVLQQLADWLIRRMSPSEKAKFDTVVGKKGYAKHFATEDEHIRFIDKHNGND